ncbi:MAG: ISL3 family transposase [Sinobacteraceae bacterium]|nr:ISL3 family transposase [Nevskiaceae bacterium]
MAAEQLFEAALGIEAPWYVRETKFDAAARMLTIVVDFRPGSRFPHPAATGLHPVHDTVPKRLRHLNFFQHECVLEVRVPRLRLPDGKVALVELPWAGKLAGFTLLFEALVVTLCQQMPFAAVARLVGESWHRVSAIAGRYVELALEQADFSHVRELAVDETSRARGHEYLTLAADAAPQRRAVIFVTEGRDAEAIARPAADLKAHRGDPAAIEGVSLDMSPAFIKGVTAHLPNAQITFDKFHVVAHASKAVDDTRRVEARTDPAVKGLRWALLKDYDRLTATQRRDLDALKRHLTTKRTARAWLYREQLREILDRKQIHVVARLLRQWCTNVMRSEVTAMKTVARMIRTHWDGVLAWARTRATNGFLEAINGLFQAAKRKARGYQRLTTIRTVIFLLAGKLDFSTLNPHIGQLQPT